MNRSEAVKLIIGHEGGYVNNPKDPGGETKFGIAKKYYPNEDIRGMTLDRATEIYIKDYWNKCRCDELNMGVALYIFDTAVNQGCKFAVKMLQQALNIPADGIIGPQTINSSNTVSTSALLNKMSEIRIQRYKDTKNFETFGKGWLNREKSTLKEAKKIC